MTRRSSGADLRPGPRHLRAVAAADRRLLDLVQPVLRHASTTRSSSPTPPRSPRSSRPASAVGIMSRRPRPVHPRHRRAGQLRLRLADRRTASRSGWASSSALLIGVAVGVVNGLISLRGFNPIIVTHRHPVDHVRAGRRHRRRLHHPRPGRARASWAPGATSASRPRSGSSAALYLIGTIFLTRTRDGIRFMAVGGNAEAVRRSGIHSDRYKVLGLRHQRRLRGAGRADHHRAGHRGVARTRAPASSSPR